MELRLPAPLHPHHLLLSHATCIILAHFFASYTSTWHLTRLSLETIHIFNTPSYSRKNAFLSFKSSHHVFRKYSRHRTCLCGPKR